MEKKTNGVFKRFLMEDHYEETISKTILIVFCERTLMANKITTQKGLEYRKIRMKSHMSVPLVDLRKYVSHADIPAGNV